LQQSLSSHVLKQLAKKVGFVQRSSKYQAKDLVALCVWLSQKVANTSLTQLCCCLESSTGVLMSPEGLNQRFNPSRQFTSEIEEGKKYPSHDGIDFYHRYKEDIGLFAEMGFTRESKVLGHF
jgi:hypothetical protein